MIILIENESFLIIEKEELQLLYTRISRNNIWTVSRDNVANEMGYYLYDGRGSVIASTWYNGMVTNVYQYDPYGQVTLGSTEHRDVCGYNGESYNPNSGLEYLRARYYNADKGRFFQEDSYLGDVTEPLTLNRYAYVKNSPLNYMDPSGFISDALRKAFNNSNLGKEYSKGKQRVDELRKEIDNLLKAINDDLLDQYNSRINASDLIMLPSEDSNSLNIELNIPPELFELMGEYSLAQDMLLAIGRTDNQFCEVDKGYKDGNITTTNLPFGKFVRGYKHDYIEYGNNYTLNELSDEFYVLEGTTGPETKQHTKNFQLGNSIQTGILKYFAAMEGGNDIGGYYINGDVRFGTVDSSGNVAFGIDGGELELGAVASVTAFDFDVVIKLLGIQAEAHITYYLGGYGAMAGGEVTSSGMKETGGGAYIIGVKQSIGWGLSDDFLK